MNSWKLATDLSIEHCALIINNTNPEAYDLMPFFYKGLHEHKSIVEILKSAVLTKRFEAYIVLTENGEINSSKTLIPTDELKKWLMEKGFTNNILFENLDIKPNGKPDYLNTDHPNYSPKLAAAINAWLAVSNNPDLLGKKSVPKQALAAWLEKNINNYTTLNNKINHIETAIDDCAKVANWQYVGGAPKT